MVENLIESDREAEKMTNLSITATRVLSVAFASMPTVCPKGKCWTGLLTVISILSFLTGTVSKCCVTSSIRASLPTWQFTLRTVLSNRTGAFRTLLGWAATGSSNGVTLVVAARAHLNWARVICWEEHTWLQPIPQNPSWHISSQMGPVKPAGQSHSEPVGLQLPGKDKAIHCHGHCHPPPLVQSLHVYWHRWPKCPFSHTEILLYDWS